jgi:hypothetical protein
VCGHTARCADHPNENFLDRDSRKDHTVKNLTVAALSGLATVACYDAVRPEYVLPLAD